MRILATTAAIALATIGTPASAQFFFQPPNLKGEPVRGDEPGLGLNLPGASADEQRAALVWSLRAALNVAALQCQFEPTLLTVSNYNSMLKDHNGELMKSMNTLSNYFVRTAKDKKAGTNAFDKFGTRTYSGFSAVSAQFTFCQTAGSVGADAVFADRGELAGVAQTRMRELRNSLVPNGEQAFAGRPSYQLTVNPVRMPSMAKNCWKSDTYQAGRCGAL